MNDDISKSNQLISSQNSSNELVIRLDTESINSALKALTDLASIAIKGVSQLMKAFEALPESNKIELFHAFAIQYYRDKYKDFSWQAITHIILLKSLYLSGDRERIYAWEALCVAKDYQTPMPLWAAWAVADVAQELIENEATGTKLNSSFRSILGIDGHSRKKIKRLTKDIELYAEVQNLINFDKVKPHQAHETVAHNYEINISTFRRRMNAIAMVIEAKDNILDPFSSSVSKDVIF